MPEDNEQGPVRTAIVAGLVVVAAVAMVWLVHDMARWSPAPTGRVPNHPEVERWSPLQFQMDAAPADRFARSD